MHPDSMAHRVMHPQNAQRVHAIREHRVRVVRQLLQVPGLDAVVLHHGIPRLRQDVFEFLRTANLRYYPEQLSDDFERRWESYNRRGTRHTHEAVYSMRLLAFEFAAALVEWQMMHHRDPHGAVLQDEEVVLKLQLLAEMLTKQELQNRPRYAFGVLELQARYKARDRRATLEAMRGTAKMPIVID